MIIDGLYDYLNSFLTILLNAILYPMTKISAEVYNILNFVYSSISGIFTAFFTLANTIITYFTGFLSMLPTSTAGILILGLMLVIFLRVKKFVWGN